MTVALLAVAPVAAQVPGAWPERFWNPKALADDVILPMPCGGSIAFRLVRIPAANTLDDKRIALGFSNPDFDYAEAPRQTYVAGTLGDAKAAAARSFALAKYEVTNAQWDAVMSDECPSPGGRGMFPKIGIGWFDALSFTHRYTQWLLDNARDALPFEGPEPAFVTLPTEDEWEYAARGGSAVEPSEFRQRTYFESYGPVEEYAWHDSTSSANGKPQRGGLLGPNKLGLHDMLGNVEELVLDSFRLNHAGRLHGGSGGFVTKGGHFLTSASQIRASYRREHNHFDISTGGPTRLRTVGVRIKIGAPLLTDRGTYTEVREEWRQLPQLDFAQGSVTSFGIEDLDAIADLIEDPQLRGMLGQFGQRFTAALAQQNEQRERAVNSYLRLGGFLVSKIRDDGRRLDGLRRAVREIRKLRDAGNDVGDRVAQGEARLARGAQILRNSSNYYASVVVALADDYTAEMIRDQVSVQIRELEGTPLKPLQPYVLLYVAHVEEYRQTKLVDRSGWVDEVLKLRQP